MVLKTSTTRRHPNHSKGKPAAPRAPAGPAVPREIIEEAENVLQSIVSSSLVPTALSRSGKMVSEKAGHLTGQTWVNGLCGAALGSKDRKSLVKPQEAMASLQLWQARPLGLPVLKPSAPPAPAWSLAQLSIETSMAPQHFVFTLVMTLITL